MLQQIAEQFAALPKAELLAVVLAVGYLLLAIRENIWCWLCAGISTAIYVVLFAGAKLYMESLLNAFYFAMAAYGWWCWRHGAVDGADRPVTIWPLRSHVYAIGGILTLSLGTGFSLDRLTDAAFPYVDSLTTFASFWATFLVARKVLENWWYWLVIDIVSIFIYWNRDLQLTAALFLLYVIMIPFGLVAWTRSYRAQSVSP